MQDYRMNYVLSLKDVLFLSMLDSCFPAKRHQDVSPGVRIPKPYIPEAEKPPDFAHEEAEKNKKETDEEDRPNIRVRSTPRPRAVISSRGNERQCLLDCFSVVYSISSEKELISVGKRLCSIITKLNALNRKIAAGGALGCLQIKGEHQTALKNHKMVQNRHTTRSHIFARSPVKTSKSKDEDDADGDFEVKRKKGSGTTVSSQRRHIITERPSWQDP
ncbi:hypothetical protein DITRI_Ditri08aG0025900 [Diplodiscus trichospermus]